MLLWASTAGAQNRYKPLCDDEAKRLCAQAVVQGETVPFDGQCLTTDKAIEQAQRAHGCQGRIDIELRRCARIANEKLEHRRTICAIEMRGLQLEVDLLTRRLQDAYDAADGPWYRHPVVVAGVSVLGTVAAIWAGVQVVNAAR